LVDIKVSWEELFWLFDKRERQKHHENYQKKRQ
jgi:hypothetical protein